MLEKTVYMQGGGYLLSKDMVAAVASRAEEPLEHLPEDAILAQMIGQDNVRRCMCSDLRIVKEAYNFQNVDLFANSECLGIAAALPLYTLIAPAVCTWVWGCAV